ncbi:MAG: hypothetical protein MI921_11475, partial [Cytophagales bacterium]|nr:hypothetical protein [Cytophagales bacterium]
MNTTEEPNEASTRGPRPVTFRVPAEMQTRLLAISQMTGMSMSQLLREGAQLVIDNYLGEAEDIDQIVDQAQRRVADRVRLLLRSPAPGASYESAREVLAYVASHLTRRLDELEGD